MLKRIIVVCNNVKEFEKYLRDRLHVEYVIKYNNLADLENIKVRAITVHDEEFIFKRPKSYLDKIKNVDEIVTLCDEIVTL